LCLYWSRYVKCAKKCVWRDAATTARLVTSWILEYALRIDPMKGKTLARDEFQVAFEHELKLAKCLVDL
jgi:hypothetical protein